VKLAMVRAVPKRVARHGAADRLTIRCRKAGSVLPVFGALAM
jgi:hypothetical protein